MTKIATEKLKKPLTLEVGYAILISVTITIIKKNQKIINTRKEE